MYVNFDDSIDVASYEYCECIKGEIPKYLRSMPSGCTPINFINFIKILYKKNSSLKSKAKSQIPKIIHQIWLGSDYPQEYNDYKKSWQDNHSGWEYILWTEDLITKEFNNNFYNQKLYDQAINNKNYAKASDIARYEILYRFGGLYTDCDSQCFKEFDLLNFSYDFYAGLEHLDNGLVIGNATIGAKKNHDILRQCLLFIKEDADKEIDLTYWKGLCGYPEEVEKEYATTLVATGPILFSKAVWYMADKNQNKDIIFPPTYFYPMAETKDYPIRTETFSCHYFKGVWKKSLQEQYKI